VNEDTFFALLMVACVLLIVDELADAVERWRRRRR